jgi:hypothetical protein
LPTIIEMKECVVYHCWNCPDDEPPIKNLRSPLIISIALLRACNENIPIYVIDGSEPGETIDLKDLAERLNFAIVPMTCSLSSYPDAPGWKNLSRIFDIEKLSQTIEEDVILYNDTDVFWIQDPLPLHQDPSKFCFNVYNSGFFYYDKNKIYPRFLEIFKAYAITAMNDEAFRYITWQYSHPNPSYLVLDEAILCYLWHKHPHLFNKIELKEHWMASSVDLKHIDVEGVKMIHGNGLHVYNKFGTVHWKKNYARGLMPLLVQECYDRFITKLDLKEVYSAEEIDYYAPLRIKFSDHKFLENLLNCRTPEGLFDWMTAAKQFHNC